MSQGADVLSIGVIGAGFVSQVAHLPAFDRIADCRLAALADSRPQLVEQVADRYRIPLRLTDYRKILDDPAIDAFVVAVPRRAQSAVVRDVLKAGRPVLTEKPLAYTATVARELVALARGVRVPLAVGYMRLSDPGVRLFCRLIKECVENGEMGDLLHVRATDFCGAYAVPVPFHLAGVESRRFRYAEDPASPEFVPADLHAAYDYTVNVAGHDISLLRALFGAELEVASFRVRPGRAQQAIFSLRSADVDLAMGPADLGSWEQRVDLYFRNGSLSLVLESSLDRQSCASVIRRRPAGEEILRPIDRVNAFDLQASSFVKGLRQSTPDMGGAEEAAAVMETIEEMWRVAAIAA